MSVQVLPSTLEFLGEKVSKAAKAAPLVEVEGVSRSAFARLSVLLTLSAPELFQLAGGAPRTYYRLLARKAPITGAQADSVLRIARIVEQATRVLGDEERARGWLNEPSAFLDDQAPLQLLGSDAGAQLVERELTRIQWGDY